MGKHRMLGNVHFEQSKFRTCISALKKQKISHFLKRALESLLSLWGGAGENRKEKERKKRTDLGVKRRKGGEY